MKYKELDMYFDHVNNIFKEVDKTFKTMEQMMDRAFIDAEPEPWTKWFAWYPVRINNKRQWMKTVYRRHKLKFGDQRLISEWEYTDIFGVIKDAN